MPREFENLAKEIAANSKEVSVQLLDMAAAAELADKAFASLTETQKKAAAISATFSKASKESKKASEAASTGHEKLRLAIVKEKQERDNLQKIMKRALTESAKHEKEAEKARKTTEKTVKVTKKSTVELKENTKEVKRATKEMRSFRDEVEDAVRSGNPLIKMFQEGADEAKRFAGGLGVSSGALIGAGVGMVYLANKAGELLTQFREAAKGLAEFNVQQKALSKTTYGFDTSRFDDLRTSLSLTREQAAAFNKEMVSAASDADVSISKTIAAAKQLQETFGGDPTERLREYLDLIEKIPTLETDLSVTATMDDKAGSLFALAKEGKISATLDLQSAGLLGGVGAAAVSPKDAALLNSAQKGEKIQQDIKDWLLGKLYPAVGPQLAAISEMTRGLFNIVGGTMVAAGALNLFLSRKQIAATRDVENAIWATSKGGLGGRPPRLPGRSTFDAFRRGGLRGGMTNLIRRYGGAAAGKAYQRGGIRLAGPLFLKNVKAGIAPFTKSLIKATKASKLFIKNLTGAAKGVFRTLGGGIAGPAGVISAAFSIAGMAAGKLSKKLKDAGKETESAVAGLAGELMSATGTIAGFVAAGALLGSVVPGIGNAAGAIIGGLVGVAKVMTDFEAIGGATERLGKALQKTVKIKGDDGKTRDVSVYRKSFEDFGKRLESAGKLAKQFGVEFNKSLAAAKKIAISAAKDIFISTLIPAYGFAKVLYVMGKAVLENISKSDEYKAALKESGIITRQLNREFNGLMKESDKYKEAMSEAQKGETSGWLQFERQLTAIDAAVASAKYQFEDLRKEVAGADLGMLTELGGTAGQFQMAMGEATSSMNVKFGQLTKALGKRREEIVKDGTINGKQRQMLLTQLHQYELKAVKEFVDGMHDLMTKMLDAPGIIFSELKKQIKAQRMEFGTEQGVVSPEDITKGAAGTVEDAVSALNQTVDKLKDVQKLNEELEKTLAERAKREKESAIKESKGLAAGTKAKYGLENVGGLDAKTADANLAKITDTMNGLQKNIDSLAESLPTGTFTDMVKRSDDMKNEIARVAKDLIDAQDEMAKLKGKEGGSEKIAEQEQKINKLIERSNNLTKERDDIEQEKVKELQRLGVSEESALQLSKMARDSSGFRADAAVEDRAAAQKAVDELAKVNGWSKEATAKLKEYLTKVAEHTELTKAAAILQGVASAETNLQNKKLQHQLEMEKKLQERVKAVTDAIGDINAYMEKTRKGSPIGKQIEAALDFSEAKMAFAEFAEDTTKTAVDAAHAGMAAIRSRAAMDRKAVEDWAEMQQSTVGARAAGMAAAGMGDKKTIEEGLRRTIEAQKQAKLERLKTDEVSEQLEYVEKATKIQIEQVGIMRDANESAKEIVENFNGSAQAVSGFLKAGLDIEKDALTKLQQQAAEARAIDAKGVAARKLELEVIKQQAVVRKTELENVKKMAELRMQELDTRQEGLDDELSFLDYMGANFRRMLDVQGEMVDLAREKYKVEQNTLNEMVAAGVQGQVRLAQETKVRKAWYELQKKSVGVQKDVMEKILGAAIAPLRGEFGARQGRNRMSAALGIEGTRVFTASGMPMKAAGPGGGGTLAERAIKRQLEGLGRPGGQAPKKLPIEEQIEKSVSATSKKTDAVVDNTKSTAAAVGGMFSLSSKRGSLFVHDEGAQSLLSGILAAVQIMAEGFKVTPGKASAGAESVKDAIDKARQEAKKNTDKVAESVKGVEVQVQSSNSNQVENLMEKMLTAQNELNGLVASGAGADKIAAQLDKLVGLQNAYRTREMENPLAGAVPVSQDFERIMSGKMTDSVKNAATALTELQKKSSEAAEIQKETGSVAEKNAKMQERQEKFRQEHPVSVGKGGTQFGNITRLEGKGPASAFGKKTTLEGKGPASAFGNKTTLEGKGGAGKAGGTAGAIVTGSKAGAKAKGRKGGGPTRGVPGKAGVTNRAKVEEMPVASLEDWSQLPEEVQQSLIAGGEKPPKGYKPPAKVAVKQKNYGDPFEFLTKKWEEEEKAKKGAPYTPPTPLNGAIAAKTGMTEAGGITTAPGVASIQETKRPEAASVSKPGGEASSMVDRVGTATVPQPTGGDAGGGAASKMEIKGELTVHFEGTSFKDTIATLVAELIGKPEVGKALTKAGRPPNS